MSDLDHDIEKRGAYLLNQLLGDPRTAEEAEKLVAKINPNAQFPMRDRREALIAPVMTELEKERARVAALEAKWAARETADAEAAQRRAEDELLARVENVKAKRGFSDEMMTKVMDRMRANNNPDVDAAAAWVAESVPKAGPATGHDFLPTTVDPFGTTSGEEKWQSLHKDPDRWLTSELRSIAKDPEFARLGGG